eukprot:502494-Prymnesium_polylepis.1
MRAMCVWAVQSAAFPCGAEVGWCRIVLRRASRRSGAFVVGDVSSARGGSSVDLTRTHVCMWQVCVQKVVCDMCVCRCGAHNGYVRSTCVNWHTHDTGY